MIFCQSVNTVVNGFEQLDVVKMYVFQIMIQYYSHHIARPIAVTVMAMRVMRGMMRVKGRGEGMVRVEEEEEEKGDLFTRCCACE